jgi:membrane glycosyltransferase
MDGAMSPAEATGEPVGQPVDQTAAGLGGAPAAAGQLATPFLPPEVPGSMPVQRLSADVDAAARHKPLRPDSWWAPAARRLFVFGGAALVAGFSINEMRLVLNVEGLTVIETVVLVLFAINTAWISLSLPTALAGFFRLLFRRDRRAAGGPLTSRTAILMPLYNEEPAGAAAAIEAMTSELVALGEGHSFDLFILSDTTDGDIALAEEEVVWTLRRQVGETMAIFYRRRERNTAHKSGNIREFCERWGRAYDHLLILDADSLMEGATMIELARRMENDADAGLIQTVPRLHDGTTLVARMQQFAGSVYGPVLSAGLAWWTGREGNFWGHNAIVRARAFMESAGLPELPGAPPFGGPILSHDFVEAALLRRAGWSVVIADDLQGSYEASPATLVDLAIRDRRWCQGNLQHVRVLGARGLHWVSRFHLLMGIFAFLSSPLWLLFIVAALALGVQNEFARTEYFTRSITLFPVWPHLDPVRAFRTFLLSLAILGAPKALGLLSFAASGKRPRGLGIVLFPFSFALELLLSALLAPVMMLIHCGLVVNILAGRDSGWNPQRRGDQTLPWREVAYRHRWHVVVGLLLAFAGRSISWQMVAWLSPAAIGMVVAVPLSLFTGSARVGRWPRRMRLLQTPDEAVPPLVWRALTTAHGLYREVVSKAPDLAALAADSEKLRRHLALTDRGSGRARQSIEPAEATADLKVRSAETLEDAVAHLTPRERAHVQSEPDLLLALSRLPRISDPLADGWGRGSGTEK